ncbi:hypothetical protein [Pseudalkalibacillus hwajinpoensis]|uniref:DUF2642 domain-containing protein n=1 Tax=Guptibacillus hwajinpoensis TaxID=208199 RepID=A0A4V5PYQ8_9BACL|nr:hypothetical protein [Pseudalkalibacillus hwajinpoensis]TKD71048.1 hypothetical protein FBF83_10665 [Pseudalkalibacillus hwajinpoensis]
MPNNDGYYVKAPTINDIHDQTLIKYFEDWVGRKVIILVSSFPFVFIGVIAEVIDDFVVVDVETTSISQLEDREWFIHIHDIEVFYIDEGEGPRIPDLKDGD